MNAIARPHRIITGDCRAALANLDAGSVQCCVTSPPYYWQRDYEIEGQIGLEQTPVEFVAALVDVFRGVRHVLRDDGTAWLNLGDSYYSGKGQPGGSDPRSPSRDWMRKRLRPLDQGGWNIPRKSLLGIPWLVAHALQADGWTLRQEIIWCRESALPEPSVKDRPHRQHETLFLLSKAPRYYFDRSAMPEESVWHIPHSPAVDGHGAAYPVALAERCIAAGTRRGDLVLDPFLGSGTTALAADRIGRACVGIELNPVHADRARGRVKGDCPLFVSVE